MQFEKTRMCRFYLQGACRYEERGAQCPFAHADNEVKVRPDLNKTSLCSDWAKGKCCKSAAQCNFAHGVKELRKTDAFFVAVGKKGKGDLKSGAKNKQRTNVFEKDALDVGLQKDPINAAINSVEATCGSPNSCGSPSSPQTYLPQLAFFMTMTPEVAQNILMAAQPEVYED
mmetsp:Transcript_71670/g.113301  ORF Transcript_71670/g.113301 Transcript_71670/m.113301 type:complete len:172 (+) Transcript_71670:3-518(+)